MDSGIKDLQEKIESFPYWSVWEVKELQKITAWVTAMLRSSMCKEYPVEFIHLFAEQESFPDEIKKLIIREVDLDEDE
ncbi:hypothetical protein ACFO25_12505 [Paenactinomyces guangxiensis]|uniref:Uncharacterized protein n=1 Tax=Paenactinomyces guangxiensis TaxID=1490290 RepID=A0A7W2A8T8_9BACL|nr:hypothetical protein [Paenactinomyces guangxiensis]MBA4494554.1 hypothetical protein [Paenactinomyces guangxiensis]MBH8591684.1 hypothetical protein [Paenactinomyces guangxiensis]